MMRAPIDLPPILSVELIQITDQTSIPFAAEAAKTLETIKEEREKLQKTKDEKAWYVVCDEIKNRRNGQYPAYLSREILEMYQEKFPPSLS